MAPKWTVFPIFPKKSHLPLSKCNNKFGMEKKSLPRSKPMKISPCPISHFVYGNEQKFQKW